MVALMTRMVHHPGTPGVHGQYVKLGHRPSRSTPAALQTRGPSSSVTGFLDTVRKTEHEAEEFTSL